MENSTISSLQLTVTSPTIIIFTIVVPVIAILYTLINYVFTLGEFKERMLFIPKMLIFTTYQVLILVGFLFAMLSYVFNGVEMKSFTIEGLMLVSYGIVILLEGIIINKQLIIVNKINKLPEYQPSIIKSFTQLNFKRFVVEHKPLYYSSVLSSVIVMALTLFYVTTQDINNFHLIMLLLYWIFFAVKTRLFIYGFLDK